MSISGTQERKKEQRVSAPSARILVVDDSKDCADSLCMLLTILGHQALAVYDGFQALERMKAFHPDVVVLDIGLPGIDGREVARRLRTLPALQNVLLIALTGYGQEKDRIASYEAGINYHLVKPLDPEVIGKLISAHVVERN